MFRFLPVGTLLPDKTWKARINVMESRFVALLLFKTNFTWTENVDQPNQPKTFFSIEHEKVQPTENGLCLYRRLQLNVNTSC